QTKTQRSSHEFKTSATTRVPGKRTGSTTGELLSFTSEGLSSNRWGKYGRFAAFFIDFAPTPLLATASASVVLGFLTPFIHGALNALFDFQQMIDEVQSTKLPNGIVVLTEHMPGLRSVTAGIWVRRGSRHETPELNGICHFIEHAVFKGTRRRTARDIAVETDQLGGHLDAYTTHEMTGFAIKVADKSLPQALDLLTDLLANPKFDQNDLDREQKVILEEMKMVEDTPDELLGELFNAAYFPGH